ncbi:MAG: hypothetical protein ORN54_03320, partial [Cyclobacteriaceae bacterium]|nr:hypothetical protein [Cyclobacteriaceae bacterium]
MKNTLIIGLKIFFVSIVIFRIVLFFSIESFSKDSCYCFLSQAIECEMDGEEKADFELEDEFYAYGLSVYSYPIQKLIKCTNSNSVFLTEGLISEIVPPPPKG